MNFSDIHDCENSHDKIVCIYVDKFGNTFCDYCKTPVDYASLSNLNITDPNLKELLRLTGELRKLGVK